MSYVDPAFAQMFGGARRMRQPAFGQMQPMEVASGLPQVPQGLPDISQGMPELPGLEPLGGMMGGMQPAPIQPPRPIPQEPKYNFMLESPQEQKDILSGYKQAAIGGLQKTGNLLSTPGDVIRNLIAGKGSQSFAPLADPLSGESRTSGRDLLRMYGIAGPQDTWTNFLGGLAVDIATDPLTPLTMFGGALGKGGKILQKAGALEEARFVKAKELGKQVGYVGPREAQATTTLSEMLPYLNARQKSIVDRELAKLSQAKREAALNRPLGSMATYGLPFMEPVRIGTQGMNAAAAKTMDTALRKFQFDLAGGIVNKTRRLFDQSIGETTEPTAQAYRQRSYRKQQEDSYVKREAIADLMDKFNDFGLLDEGRQQELRKIFETPSRLATLPLLEQENIKVLQKAGFDAGTANDEISLLFSSENYLAIQPAEVKQAVANLSSMGYADPAKIADLKEVVKAEDFIKTLPEELQRAVIETRQFLSRDLYESQLMGLPKSKYEDEFTRYFPRYKTPEETRMEMQTTRFGQNEPSLKERKAQLRGVVGGAETINKIYSDQEIRQLVLQGASIQEVRDMIGQKYGDLVPERYVTSEEFRRVTAENKRIDRINAKIADDNYKRAQKNLPPKPFKPRINPRTEDRFKVIAKMVENASESAVQQGIFPNSPFADLMVNTTLSSYAKTQLANAAQLLLEPGVMSTTKEYGKNVSLLSLIAKMKLRAGDIDPETGQLGKVAFDLLNENADAIDISKSKGFLYEIARQAGWDDFDLMTFKPKDIYIDKKIADNITSFVRPFTEPESVSDLKKIMDQTLNLHKAYLTGVRPAFHVRNLMSATIKNRLRGLHSVESQKDTIDLLRGNTVKNAKDIPAVRDVFVSRKGREKLDSLDDLEATKILGQILFASGQGPRMGGELTSKVGQTTDPMAGSINELLGMIPGRGNKMFSFRELGRKVTGRSEDASWNPRAFIDPDRQALIVAGKYVGGAVESLARTAPLIKLMREGYDPVQATRMVASAQVDYSSRAYTKFELQKMARLFPFYKFTRGTFPEELRELVRRPGGTQAQLIKAMSAQSESDELTPDYIAESVSLPLEGTVLGRGTPEGTDRYLTGFGFAFEDPLSFIGGQGPRGTIGEVISRMNPIPKGLIEWGSGETFFQRTPQGGRELTDTDPTIGRIISNLTGQEKAVTYPGSQGIEFIAANSPISPFLTIARQLTDPRKSNPAVKALNLLSGVKITDVSPAVKDQLLRGIIEQQMVERGAKQFLRTYYPTAELPALSDQERQEILQLQSIANMLAQRTKERKAEKEAAKLKAEQEKQMGQFQNN